MANLVLAAGARRLPEMALRRALAYFSLPQSYSRPGNAILLKLRGNPAAAVKLLERELRELESRLAIVDILPYRDAVWGLLYTQRMNAELFAVIAALGLLLATTGVFGVVALAVACFGALPPRIPWRSRSGPECS